MYDSENFFAIGFDFSRIFSRLCDSDDFEMWHALPLNDDSECLLGHYQDIQRSKIDRDCYVGKEFKRP